MRRHTMVLVCGGFAMAGGLLTASFSQDVREEITVEQRVALLELSLSSLSNQMAARTDVGSGPQDRSNRDYNLDLRFGELERRLQLIDNELMNLQRQVSDAVRIANQAQSDAQMAQQEARNAASRPF